MGADDGSPPTKNPHHLPKMSQRYSRRTGRWTPTGMRTLESDVFGNLQASFGGGQGEKGRVSGTSPAAYPTFVLGSLARVQTRSRSGKRSDSSSNTTSGLPLQKKNRIFATVKRASPSSDMS